MARHMADLRQDAPAALATFAGRQRHDDADIRHVRQGEGARRRRRGLHGAGRGDAQLREIDIPQRGNQRLGREDLDRGLQA